MAAAAILNCEKHSQFLYYLTYSHQTWWGCCKFDVECNCWVRNEHKDWSQRWWLPPYWISKRCGHFSTIIPFVTKHVVNIKYRPAGRKTANIVVKNYISLERGVYRPDSTYKTAKMIYQEIFTLSWSGQYRRQRKLDGLNTSVLSTSAYRNL